VKKKQNLWDNCASFLFIDLSCEFLDIAALLELTSAFLCLISGSGL